MAFKFKKISADEAHSLRKDHVRATPKGEAVIKAGNILVPETRAGRSYDPESRTARFIMTSQGGDRYGDSVVTEGVDTREFERNPVALLFHNSRTWPVGTWKDLEKVLKGRPPRLEGDLHLLPAGGPVKEVDEAAWMLENGGLRACSIGFVPDWDAIESILDDEGHWTGLRFMESELIECSICPVPANPDALMKMAEGNMMMARELIEDILDNWTRNAAGVLIKRSDLEAAHAATAPAAPKLKAGPAIPLAAGPTVVLTDEQAAALATITTAPAVKVVDTVTVKAADAVSVETVITGKFVDAVDKIIAATEAADAAAKAAGKESAGNDLLLPVTDPELLAAEHRGIEFALAKICPPHEGMVIALEGHQKGFVQVVGGKMKLLDGDAPASVNMVVKSALVADKPAYEITKLYATSLIKGDDGQWEAKDLSVSKGSDHVDEVTSEDADGVVGVLDGLKEKLVTLFKRAAPQERIEPKLDTPVAPPAAHVIEVAKARAAASLQRVARHLN